MRNLLDVEHQEPIVLDSMSVQFMAQIGLVVLETRGNLVQSVQAADLEAIP